MSIALTLAALAFVAYLERTRCWDDDLADDEVLDEDGLAHRPGRMPRETQ